MVPAHPFVGRSAELAELERAMDVALTGRVTTVLVRGDPGVGKSRLVEEFGRITATRAVLVLSGRATREQGAPPFWPWRQILRGWLAGADRDSTRTILDASGAGADELVRIAPELRSAGVIAAEAGTPTAEAEQRFSLFERMGSLLGTLASARGLLIVLDDLHWADPASLLLLHHVARELGAARLMIVGVSRPTGIRHTPESTSVGEIFAEIGRLPTATRLDLAGLTDAEVRTQLAAILGRPPDPTTVRTVMRRTAGNPLLVLETGRLMTLRNDVRGDGDAVPEAARHLIGRHLATISNDCRALLAHAAVLGVDIDVRRIAAITGVDIDDVLSHLDEALATGVVVKVPGTSGYRFAHDLMRECCDADNSPAQRARLHARAAELLAERADEHDVSEIAHHRFRALPLGDPNEAIAAGRRAAELAIEQLAFEDAIHLYSSCLDAAGLDGNSRIRCGLLIDRARARYLAVDVAGAMADCDEAATIARRTGDAAALGRAALVLQDVSRPDWNAEIQSWCRRALAELDVGDSPLRAQLLAQHAISRIEEIESPDMQTAGREALAMAERLGDPAALRAAMRAQQLAHSSPEGIPQRLDLANRMERLAERTHDDPTALWGHLWRFDALVQLGRVDDAEAELDRVETVVSRLRRPLARWHLLRCRAAVHLARGRFEEALSTTDEATAVAARAQHASQLSAAAVKLAVAALTGDREGSGIPPLPDELPAPIAPMARLLYAEWHVASGRLVEANRLYRLLPPLSSHPLPWLRPSVAAYRGVLAAALSDGGGAEAAYTELQPYVGLHVASGAGVVVTRGSTHHHLGVVAAASGRAEAAADHLRVAVAANVAAGVHPCAAEAACALADVLSRGDGPENRAELQRHARAALDIAVSLGMRPVADRARALLDALPPAEPLDPLSPREREIAILVARGLTNRQIATAAHISERTAANHVQHILTKLGFTSRSQVASWVTARTLVRQDAERPVRDQ